MGLVRRRLCCFLWPPCPARSTAGLPRPAPTTARVAATHAAPPGIYAAAAGPTPGGDSGVPARWSSPEVRQLHRAVAAQQITTTACSGTGSRVADAQLRQSGRASAIQLGCARASCPVPCGLCARCACAGTWMAGLAATRLKGLGAMAGAGIGAGLGAAKSLVTEPKKTLSSAIGAANDVATHAHRSRHKP